MFDRVRTALCKQLECTHDTTDIVGMDERGTRRVSSCKESVEVCIPHLDRKCLIMSADRVVGLLPFRKAHVFQGSAHIESRSAAYDGNLSLSKQVVNAGMGSLGKERS